MGWIIGLGVLLLVLFVIKQSLHKHPVVGVYLCSTLLVIAVIAGLVLMCAKGTYKDTGVYLCALVAVCNVVRVIYHLFRSRCDACGKYMACTMECDIVPPNGREYFNDSNGKRKCRETHVQTWRCRYCGEVAERSCEKVK